MSTETPTRLTIESLDKDAGEKISVRRILGGIAAATNPESLQAAGVLRGHEAQRAQDVALHPEGDIATLDPNA